jgi:hypothetical protein
MSFMDPERSIQYPEEYAISPYTVKVCFPYA